MTETIKFSCIVTCYNREKLISRALHSILDQTFQDFEIIVVDDASKDNSVAEIEKINDSRIKLIKNEKNGGQNFALNVGISASKYSYLAFLDSDDEWLPTYLMEMYKVYDSNPTIGFAYSNFTDEIKLTLEGEKKYAEALNQGFLSSMISITAKKNAVEHIGRFDLRYTICQDDDFCFRLAKEFSFKVIEQNLVVIHVSENSMSIDQLNSAEGWAFLFEDYKDDIIKYCGYRTLSKHTINLSRRFFSNNEFRKGLHYYLLSLTGFIKGTKFKKFDYPLSEFMKLSFTILKLNLGKFKRYLIN